MSRSRAPLLCQAPVTANGHTSANFHLSSKGEEFLLFSCWLINMARREENRKRPKKKPTDDKVGTPFLVSGVGGLINILKRIIVLSGSCQLASYKSTIIATTPCAARFTKPSLYLDFIYL